MIQAGDELDRKERIYIRVSPRVRATLAAAGSRPGLTQAQIVETALDAFFSEGRDDERDAGIIRRLDQLTRQVHRLERNDLILSEAVTLLLRFLFTATPPMATGEMAAAQRLADRRMESFLKRLATQVGSGRRILQEALEEILPEPGDFASLSDIDFEQPVVRSRANGGAAARNGGPAPRNGASLEGEERPSV